MMGERTVVQKALFYSFNLEQHVPADHMLRSIDRFVDLSGLRAHFQPYYSTTGRPSVDPELMVRMLIIGYCQGIRSERRLCEEVYLNLAYRWFCRLGLEGQVPDHSTFSKNRHGRFRDSDLLRHLFEHSVRHCMEEGLVGGEAFAVDASLIKADASRQKGVEGSRGLPPEATSRAIDECLSVLDDAAFGAASEVTPKSVSPADPAAHWAAAHGGQAFFAYSTNYLIDLDHAVIVDAEASTAAPRHTRRVFQQNPSTRAGRNRRGRRPLCPRQASFWAKIATPALPPSGCIAVVIGSFSALLGLAD